MSPPHALARLLHSWLATPAWLRACAPVAVAGVIWIASARPRGGGSSSVVEAFAHNGAHVLAFGGLGSALWCVGRGRGGALIGALLYGLLDELHQRHVPGRACSVVDLATDGVGALLFITMLHQVFRPTVRAMWQLALLFLLTVSVVSLATFGPW